MIAGIDPEVDYAFKGVFGKEGNEGLVRALLNAVLGFPPNEQIVALQLLNPFHPRKNLGDFLPVGDVKARDARYPPLTSGDDYGALLPTWVVRFLNARVSPACRPFSLVFSNPRRCSSRAPVDGTACHPHSGATEVPASR